MFIIFLLFCFSLTNPPISADTFKAFELFRPLKMGIGISSPSSDYEMEHYLGSGAYGAVVQSKKLATNETVALKVIKNERYMEVAKKEVKEKASD